MSTDGLTIYIRDQKAMLALRIFLVIVIGRQLFKVTTGLTRRSKIEHFILSVRLGLRTPLSSECALAQGQQIEHTNMN